MRFKNLAGFIAILSVSLSGCGGGTAEMEEEITPRQVLPTSPTSIKGERIRHSLSDEEVLKLWRAAEQFRDVGDYKKAASLLEQAVQLAPSDPAIWSRLAELKLRADDDLIAENYAAKSNALAGSNTALKYRNWLIIQHARSKRNDSIGARKAEMKAKRLRYQQQ